MSENAFDNIVITENLTKQFNEKLAVNKVNLAIKRGSIYALLGPNGAGKTTTIRMLLGIMTPTYGNITIDGIDVVKNVKKIRGKIGLLPQVSAAYYDLNSIQNIKFILELNNISFNKKKKEIYEYLNKLELTGELLIKPFSKLSGGEQRAICFIMAIVTDKNFLILDEPTSGLDIVRAKYVRDIIRSLSKKGKTILLSSHIASDLEELAEYCGILKNGSLIFQGSKEEIIEKYAAESGNFEEAIVNAFQNGKVISQQQR